MQGGLVSLSFTVANFSPIKSNLDLRVHGSLGECIPTTVVGRWGKNTRKMGLFENLWEPIILLKRNVQFEISTVLSVSMCVRLKLPAWGSGTCTLG